MAVALQGGEAPDSFTDKVNTMRKAMLFAVLSGLVAGAACDDSTGLDREDIAGTYTATTFTTTTGGVTTDELDEGASLDLVLSANGNTTGSLVAPGGSPTLSMAGSWSLSGNTVTFSQQADSFVRNMAFQVSGNTLVGDETFSGTRIQVTLTRQ